MKNSKTVVVGLSGGVDSAVSALLLKKQGFNVIGVYMQNWEVENDDPYCSSEQDLQDAFSVCKTLEIPFETVNFAKEYWDHVFQYCLDAFSQGRTPNPDIGCNKEIKFKAFLQYALDKGADFLATGHYVRKSFHDDRYQLLKGLDTNKDQSYFLYTLGQHELAHSLFPIGDLKKTDVRKIAQENKLPNFNKKDSTGICFIGERKFKDFLSEFLLAQPGEIQNPEGKVIGTHDGIMFYTLGQRKGLKIGGRDDSSEEPWFVVGKNVETNALMVAQGQENTLLYRDYLYCTQLHWVDTQPTLPIKLKAKIRYRQADQLCELIEETPNNFLVKFTVAQRAITPGQSIVFYQDDICLGGGIII
jgi:tRNA-specific 2-thiouridylase